LKSNGLISRAGCLPYNPKLKERARELRKNLTIAENRLWQGYLRYHQLTFHRQHSIDHYIVDFYSSKFQLVIEIDGEQHFTPEGKEYDAQRDSILTGYNLKVIRFSNKEVMEEFDSVVGKIEDVLQRKAVNNSD